MNNLFLIFMIVLILFFIVCGFMIFWKYYFLRLPKRKIPKKGILCPAMGRVIELIPINESKNRKKDTKEKQQRENQKTNILTITKGLFGKINALTSDTCKKGVMIVIMLTPFDVHYQRSPIDGKVVHVKYTKGSFKNAVMGNTSLLAIENEHNEILIEGKQRKRVKVIQVAGAAARRIE